MSATPSLPSASLPDYTVRESNRAKYVNLRLSLKGGLEVVVPRGFDRQKIPAILQEKQRWIDRVSQRLETQRQQLEPDAHAPLPQKIDLRAIRQCWPVEYYTGATHRLSLTEQTGRLILQGAIGDEATCKALLRQWLTQTAKHHLVPWLRQISRETRLPFSQASVRGQRTRWGSCSNEKAISLNYKLLFLPPSLVRYVLVHELCHTVHLNHSPRFWKLVGQKEPNYEALRQELRQANPYIPAWLE